MQEKTSVPAIRFAGFTDAWEQRKLGEIAEKDYGGGTPNTANEAYWDGDIPWIQSSDLTEHQVSGVVPRKHLTERGLTDSAAKLIPADSLAIITRVGVGKLAVMPFSYTTSQDFLSLSKLNIDVWFGAYAIYKKLQSELHAVQGTSIKGITKEELLAKDIQVPIFPEQQRIGAFFRQLDHLITLHQRKYSRLCNFKKSMLERMFPRDGASVPEIRFARSSDGTPFTDAWEQRKFSELAETRRGLTYNPNNIRPSGVRVLRSSNISEDTFVFSDEDVFVEEEALNIPYIQNNDILITAANGSTRLVGKHAIIRDLPENSAVHGGFMLAASSRMADFVNALMSAPWYARFIGLYVSGGNGAIGNLNKSDLDEQIVLVPKVEEQQRIGTFFHQLDHLITLHQRELERLQNIKKSCLEKMFV